jgi:hypothetical protein
MASRTLAVGWEEGEFAQFRLSGVWEAMPGVAIHARGVVSSGLNARYAAVERLRVTRLDSLDSSRKHCGVCHRRARGWAKPLIFSLAAFAALRTDFLLDRSDSVFQGSTCAGKYTKRAECREA